MFKISKQKTIIYISLCLVAIIALSIGIAALLKPKSTPVSADYIIVTIDNSIGATFTLDKSDYSVIKSETINKADQFLVDGLGGRTYFPQAMRSFIKKMIDAKKLDTEKEEVILFSVESRNYEDFETLTSLFRNVLAESECKLRIHTLYFKVKENSIITYAQDNNVSYAKAYLCKKIERETDKLKSDDLISLSITEIVDMVNKVAKDDLLNKIEQETNEEQKNEEIKEEVSKPASNDASENSSGNNTSSDNVSSGGTSSGNTSSGNTSSNDSSSDNASSDNTSSSNTSSDNTSSDDTSSGNTSSGNTSSGNTSSDNTSSDNSSSDNSFVVEDNEDEEWSETV